VDPERTKAILQIAPPHNKKSMQSFFGRINFVRIFVPDFAEIVKPLQRMIKKDVQFKWTPLEKEAFENIKYCYSHCSIFAESIFLQRFFVVYIRFDHSLAQCSHKRMNKEMNTPLHL
jgi:hypothetical protein